MCHMFWECSNHTSQIHLGRVPFSDTFVEMLQGRVGLRGYHNPRRILVQTKAKGGTERVTCLDLCLFYIRFEVII